MTKKAFSIAVCLICLFIFSTGTIYSSLDQKTVPKANASQSNNESNKKYNELKSANGILKEMDKRMYRNALLKSEMEVWENDVKTDHFIFTNKTKNNNQNILTRFEYPLDWGNISVLMVHEDVWIYDEETDRHMQLPANMAFGATGLSYGDTLRLDISNNYDGYVISEDSNSWEIHATTKNREMPYFTIEILLDKNHYYPITMKGFSSSGKLVKTIEYSEVQEVNGIIKPTVYTFTSPYEPNKYSIIKLLDEKLVDYPDHIFNKWAMSLGIDENY